MKPFLGIDITEENNSENNEEEFIAAKTPKELSDRFDAKFAEIRAMVEKSAPLWLTVIKWVCGLVCVGMVAIIGAIVKAGGNPMTEIWKNSPWVFFVGGIGIIGFVFCMICDRKEDISEEELQGYNDEINEIVKSIEQYLGVPENAQYVDVMLCSYKTKNGEAVPKPRMPFSASFVNSNMSIFEDGENLFFASADAKYAIPLEKLKRIIKIKKKVLTIGWNKEELPDSKEYGLKCDESGNLKIDSYCILVFSDGADERGVYFPPYELPIFEKMTGLKCE